MKKTGNNIVFGGILGESVGFENRGIIGTMGFLQIIRHRHQVK